MGPPGFVWLLHASSFLFQANNFIAFPSQGCKTEAKWNKCQVLAECVPACRLQLVLRRVKIHLWWRWGQVIGLCHRSPHCPGPPSRRGDTGQEEHSAMGSPISVTLPSCVSGQSHTRWCPSAPLGGCSAQGPSLFHSVDLLILIPLWFFSMCCPWQLSGCLNLSLPLYKIQLRLFFNPSLLLLKHWCCSPGYFSWKEDSWW